MLDFRRFLISISEENLDKILQICENKHIQARQPKRPKAAKKTPHGPAVIDFHISLIINTSLSFFIFHF